VVILIDVCRPDDRYIRRAYSLRIRGLIQEIYMLQSALQRHTLPT